jgi:hypothetical protein
MGNGRGVILDVTNNNYEPSAVVCVNIVYNHVCNVNFVLRCEIMRLNVHPLATDYYVICSDKRETYRNLIKICITRN